MYGPTLPQAWMEEEFKHLSYRIIWFKIAYYYPDRLTKSISIDDDAYDQIELGYLRLCQELGRPNELVHKQYPQYAHIPGNGMIEVDFSRADVQEVLLTKGAYKYFTIAT